MNMLTGVHVILSYTCLFQCDHCFLHCGPEAGDTFTFAKLKELIEQARDAGSVKHFYFEGGEPLLFYPLLLEGVRLAHAAGFTVGIVTNGYWAIDSADAEQWLIPLQKAGLTSLSISDDEYHHGKADPSPAKAALEAATRLGLKAYPLTIDPPCVNTPPADGGKGQPIIGGGVRFRGRAADTLTKGLPGRSWSDFTSCPDEDLETPGRVHIDGQGNVQLCQGVTIGNVWNTPLKEIMENYAPHEHPICGPLLRGGPARLAEECHYSAETEFIDACHLCYRVRQHLRTTHPDALAPAQAYGCGNDQP